MFPKDKKLILLTAYDFLTAQILEEAEVDAILVGDSLGMVFEGKPNTHEVTMEQMCYHIQAVKRGAPSTFVIGDMPINSYNNPKNALSNAKKIIQSGADLVKLEGGKEIETQIKHLIQNQIPLIGHIGLKPQSSKSFKVFGKSKAEAQQLIADANFLNKAGAKALILECIPAQLSQKITQSVNIPTIGIGAGKDCNGQILVFQDLVGLNHPNFNPRFLKKYLDSRNLFLESIKSFKKDIENGKFPNAKYSY